MWGNNEGNQAQPLLLSSRGRYIIVKPMELGFHGNGYESIKDQFVLGDDIIVAPVIEKGSRSRKVVLPKGTWKAEDGKTYKGGNSIEISVPLERLPYFRKIK